MGKLQTALEAEMKFPVIGVHFVILCGILLQSFAGSAV